MIFRVTTREAHYINHSQLQILFTFQLLSLSPPPVTMDMLTRRPSPIEYSPETAHTIEVSREEDENGQFGSFGFTLLNEKPPNVGTIVPGMDIGEVI